MCYVGNRAKIHANFRIFVFMPILTVQKLRKHGMSAFLYIPKESLLLHQVKTFTQSSREKSLKNVAELHSRFCCKEWLGKCNMQKNWFSITVRTGLSS
jgi:hypothetical protein